MKNNHVAKYAHKYNRSSTHVDKKKLDKLEQPYHNVQEALQEDCTPVDDEDCYGKCCTCCPKGYITDWEHLLDYRCANCGSDYTIDGVLIKDRYHTLKDCPLCEEGKLQKMHTFDQENNVASFYYLCDNCGSEIVDAELAKINKQLMRVLI